MEYIESETLKLEQDFNEDINKTIIAFANTNGGRILVGIGSDGKVLGILDCKDTLLKIRHSCRGSIKPNISMHIKVAPDKIDDKDIICIDVSKGSRGPFYLANMGLRPGGVFVRVDNNTVAVSEPHIRALIEEASGKNYCFNITLETDLTFNVASEVFKKNNLVFDDSQKIALNIMNNQKQYSNLGLLVSDQCHHTIKCVLFQGTSKLIMRDRKEFGGSIFKQLEDAFSYVMFFNKLHAEIVGSYRVDKYDYPPLALKEALLNALTHCDYSFNGSIFINIYDDRLEILSFGGLTDGLDIKSIQKGFSQSSNPSLANIFTKLNMVEGCGTGIQRIMKLYEDNYKKPRIRITSNSFLIEFPNCNYREEGIQRKRSVKEYSVSSKILDSVLAFIMQNNSATRKQIVESTDLKPTQVFVALSSLENLGKIKTSKNGNVKIYSAL
jgi:ATP-dependent DNA helicase RecG